MFTKLYLVALTAFLLIDGIWLGFIAKGLYSKYLGHLMKQDINWIAAILFYLIFITALVVFVIQPTLQNHTLLQIVSLSVLFGLATYATYDLTNLATIQGFPLLITIIDLCWGMAVSILVSVITVFAARSWWL